MREGSVKDMAIRPKSIVPIIGEPDIDESYIRQQDVVLLTTLLIDRTMTALNGGTPVNIKWAVDDYAQEYPDRTGYGCEDQKFPPAAARRFAEIISWNIWQMDGIKFVVPNTCGKKKDMLGSSIECAGCAKNDVKLHDGVRCRVMDWEIGKPVLFMPPFEFKTIEG